MSAEKIINEWKRNIFKPVYWLEGEEEFYIDEVMKFAEHNILSEADAEFNQTIFYGKDAAWVEVINACRRYPMFASRQVVLLKEAQQMRDIEQLEQYVAKPLPSTVFVVSYKGKTMDGRSKLAKVLKEKSEIFTSKKIYENKLMPWTSEFISAKGFSITSRALLLLTEHIGNDLSRIANEIEKVIMNLGTRKEISEDDIENYVGISKDYNIFELQNAICSKDMVKAITIIQYFHGNPKAGPIQQLLVVLYNYFSKLSTIFQMNDKSERALAPMFYGNTMNARKALDTMMKYSERGIEEALLLIHEYNLKSVGIRNPGYSDSSLMKELTYKMISCS